MEYKNMSRIRTIVVLALALFVGVMSAEAKEESARSREYQVKAAFLYNFIKFIDWPEEKFTDDGKEIVIGIVGEDPFGDAFEPIEKKKVKDKKLVVRRFAGFKQLRDKEALKECHVLFICSSQQEHLKDIITTVEDSGVLTVGETEGFLEAGGIIGFVLHEKKVHFEVNVSAAEQAKLKIRSQLLRLAKRVVEEKSSGEAKK